MRDAEALPDDLVFKVDYLAFSLREGKPYSVYDVSDALRARGWQVPAYPFPPDLQDLHVLRVVVRNGFSRDLARLLLEDLRRTVDELEAIGAHRPRERRAGFHH